MKKWSAGVFAPPLIGLKIKVPSLGVGKPCLGGKFCVGGVAPDWFLARMPKKRWWSSIKKCRKIIKIHILDLFI